MSAARPPPAEAGGRILVVDDDLEMARMVAEALAKDGHEVVSESEWNEARRLAAEGGFDLIITDVRMGEHSGLDLLREAHSRAPETLVVLMTAFGTLEATIQAVREGAFDYLAKPFKLEEIRLVAQRALEQRRLLRENREMRAALETASAAPPRIIGKSPAMVEVYKTVARVAPTEATVLIRGESGTGKELIARTIHENSPRRQGPFVAVNCAAIPENLLESELFGHTRGAFTGAAGSPGVLPGAARGTVLLDEIGDMPLSLQPKILRAIDLHEVKPVGRPDPVKVDVRILAATNQNLLELVKEGAFREDLYYRINGVTITLPPLRDRPEDIPTLAEHFALLHASRHQKPTPTFPPETLRLLCSYPWPGNVRELEHAIERAVTLAAGSVIRPADLPLEAQKDEAPPLLTLEEIERRHLVRVLRATRGNRQQAAAILGIDRKTLYRKLLRHSIEEGGVEEGGTDGEGAAGE